MPVRRVIALVSVLVAVLVALLVNVLPAAAAKTYRAERFHARIVVEPNGSIVVTETLRFVFGSDSFSYVSSNLPTGKTDGILVLGATMDGQPMEPGRQAGQFELRKDNDDRRRVVWHFSATSNATHTFTLTYRAAGVAWQDAESDVLAWTLLPTRHEYLIECGSAEIDYPPSATLLGEARFTPPASESQHEGQAVRALRCPFERDRSWVVTMRFAPRTLVAVAPAWQQRSQLNHQHLPMFFGLAALVLFAGVGGFLFFALSHRIAGTGDRDLRVGTLPDGLPPALAGTLVRTGASAAWPDALGAILDLARRGVIRIEALPPSGAFRKHEVRLTRGDLSRTIMSHEQTLLDLLFNTRSGPRSSVTFSELARTFASAGRWKRVRTAIADDLRAARLLDPDRERTRRRVTIIGVVILQLAFVGFILSMVFMDRAGDPVLALPVAVLMVGIAGLVAGATLSPLSEEGLERAGRWKAFQRHLADVAEQARTSSATREGFDDWLPHAAALGTAAAWAKRLEHQGVTGGPSWLAAVERDGGSGHASMGATVAVLLAGASAGPRRGGSAGGHVGAAVGGASGAG